MRTWYCLVAASYCMTSRLSAQNSFTVCNSITSHTRASKDLSLLWVSERSKWADNTKHQQQLRHYFALKWGPARACHVLLCLCHRHPEVDVSWRQPRAKQRRCWHSGCLIEAAIMLIDRRIDRCFQAAREGFLRRAPLFLWPDRYHLFSASTQNNVPSSGRPEQCHLFGELLTSLLRF